MQFASRIARFVRCSTAVLAVASLLFPTLEAQAPPTSLQITIIDGDEAINNIRTRIAREPIVQVEDQNHKPVAGAIVLFDVPQKGAGGAFPGGAHSLSVTTDANGRAVAAGLKPNKNNGRFEINVQATFQGLTATKIISQTNSGGLAPTSASGGLPKWLSVLIVGAVAGTAVSVATKTGSTPSKNVPIAVTPGPGTVGAPR